MPNSRAAEYVLNGRKLWITNGKEAGIFVLFATVDPRRRIQGHHGIRRRERLSRIHRRQEGRQAGHSRFVSTCELILEDCHVPKENVLGEVGKGYKIAIETLNEGRIGIGAQMLGLARGAWEYAAKYAQERKQFGKPIAEFQGVQFQMAQMATEIEAGAHDGLQRGPHERCRNELREGSRDDQVVRVASCGASDVAWPSKIYGGYGFTKDYPVEKYYRDAKIGKIYEGTSNMQLQTIAKLVVGGK